MELCCSVYTASKKGVGKKGLACAVSKIVTLALYSSSKSARTLVASQVLIVPGSADKIAFQ